MEKGPLSVALNSENLQFYDGGIITFENCRPEPDHAVLIVGFGREVIRKNLIFYFKEGKMILLF